MADEDSRLDLNALADEVIRLHRLTGTSQSVVPAVQEFARRVGRDRMALAFMELAAEKIRARIAERAEAAAKVPAFTPPRPHAAPVPARVPPAVPEPEVSEVPGPQSGEEFKPGAVLWHTTESGGYEEGEPETVPVTAPLPVAEVAPVPLPVPRPLPVVPQPSRRLASMRSMTPEETWGALTELVDVGGVSKPRGDVTVEDAIVRSAFASATEKDAAKQLTEANKQLSVAHREAVLAGRELDALRRHSAAKIGDLPDYELDRLYGQRAA